VTTMAQQSVQTAIADYSVDRTILANRLSVLRARFTSGNIITTSDINELIAIIRVLQTHTHTFQDTVYLHFGNVYEVDNGVTLDTRIDSDVTQPPKLF
jgi:hypothetical protein